MLGLELHVMGIHKEGKMVGLWVRGKSGKKCIDGKHRLAAQCWPPGASVVAVLLNVVMLCAEVGFCFHLSWDQ